MLSMYAYIYIYNIYIVIFIYTHESIASRDVHWQVRKMTMISPTNKEVQIGQTLKDDEFIGMVRREVLDDFLRQRAKSNGATLINGLFIGMTMPQAKGEPYVLSYNDYDGEEGNARKGEKKTLEVDVVVGADGANSRVAKDIEAGDYEYAIAFQERMRIPDNKMDYYKDRAEMYVGEDVSPDFYAWVFPKCDHVAVGTGTVVDKKGIKKYQQGIRDRAAVRIDGGNIIRVEAHPIPEHPRPWRVKASGITERFMPSSIFEVSVWVDFIICGVWMSHFWKRVELYCSIQ